MSISRLHVPVLKPEDVVPHLGKPTHWKQGRSAKSLADSWFSANDVPAKVRAVLSQAPELASAILIDAHLERATDLGDTRGSPSQTDLLAVMSSPAGLIVMAVEAKVTESFGDPVAEWLGDKGVGKVARLAALCELLGLSPDTVGDLRYQLFHRTAAAILEARRYHATSAVMMIQSFCPGATGEADFVTFGRALGFETLGQGCLSEGRTIGGVELRLGWASDDILPGTTRQARSLEWLNDFGRRRLSKSFFMRDFLFSDIAAIHGLSNVPDDPELAVEAGTQLCEELLEPIQDKFGRIAIRSAYRSREVNAFGNEMQKRNLKGYNCADNDKNAGGHIWDLRDRDGEFGATACIVVPSFWDRFQHEPDGWQRMAWWIHDNLPYSSLEFFGTRWAFNINWRQTPRRKIYSRISGGGYLTRPGSPNHEGSHREQWEML